MAATPTSWSLTEVIEELRSRFQVERFRDNGKERASPLQADPYWTDTFHQLFVHSHQEDRDDLLFFVKANSAKGSETVEVLRRDSRSLPGPSDASVLWDQTLYLNLILHESTIFIPGGLTMRIRMFEYHITCSTVTVKPGTDAIDSFRTKITQQVYPSPTHRRMDKKGKISDIVYPNIMFYVDNFEEVFSDVHLQGPGEKVAVQLIASNKGLATNQMVFLGAVDYSSLEIVHERKEQVPLRSKLKNMSVIHKHNSRVYGFSHTYKFIRMRGPELKGFAEMAVWKGAVVQPQFSNPVQTSSTSSKSTPTLHRLSPGTDEEGVAQQTDTKGSQSEQAPTNISSELHLPASVLSKGVSRVEIQSSSESKESSGDKSHLDAHRVDSGFSASNGSSEESSEREEYTDSATKSEAHKKGTVKGRFNLRSKLHVKRRKQREGGHSLLFAHLTYVQLPWYILFDDILNSTRKPPL